MLTERRFPAVTAAVARRRDTYTDRDRAAAMAATTPEDKERRWRMREAQDAHRDARAAALEAYAAELLPAVLGGSWRLTSRGALIPYRHPWRLRLFGHPLIDHPSSYRRKETKGPITWHTGAMIAEPYGALAHDTGLPTEAAVAQARLLRKEMNLGVWACAALSTWFPGATALILIAQDLPTAEAEGHGFIALS